MTSSLKSGWVLKPLLEVATLQRGYDLPVQNRTHGNVPIFAANGPVGDHNEAKVSGPGVVTGRSGSIGKVHYVEADYWPLNTSLYVKNFHGNNPKFIYYLLSTLGLEKYAEGTGVPTLNRNNVHGVEIPLPPLPEQKRIAAILDKADSIRRKRQEAVRLTEELLRSVFLDMFGDPVTNPKGWETILLGKHTKKIGSGATPTGGESAYKETGISLIRSMNVHDGEFIYKNLAYIDEVQAEKLANVTVEDNDVLLNITGASVARVCRVPSKVLPARVNQHVSIIRPRSKLNPVFLEHLLLSGSVKKGLLQLSGGGATREAITKAQIEELKIICPPIDIQNMYSDQVAVIEKMNDFASHATLEIENLFNSLLQRSFNCNT